VERAPSGPEAASKLRGAMPRQAQGAGGCRDRLREAPRRLDPRLPPRTVPRARHRRVRTQRYPGQAAPLLRGEPVLDRGARAARPRRGRRGSRLARRGGDEEVRARSGKAKPGDGLAMDVLVPDIGDFKDIPVIEVLVKPGDEVAAEASLITLESDKATM